MKTRQKIFLSIQNKKYGLQKNITLNWDSVLYLAGKRTEQFLSELQICQSNDNMLIKQLKQLLGNRAN